MSFGVPFGYPYDRHRAVEPALSKVHVLKYFVLVVTS